MTRRLALLCLSLAESSCGNILLATDMSFNQVLGISGFFLALSIPRSRKDVVRGTLSYKFQGVMKKVQESHCSRPLLVLFHQGLQGREGPETGANWPRSAVSSCAGLLSPGSVLTRVPEAHCGQLFVSTQCSPPSITQ